ncbi:MAG TPA: pyridoxal-phosphate dependent enzyme, partial [Mycobacteriales bacterium]
MTSVLDAPAATANPAVALECKNCHARQPLAPTHVCPECWAPLEIAYDDELLKAWTRADVEAGPQTLWRYAGWLPAGHDPATRVDIGTGLSRLVKADTLAAELGMKSLWVKDESGNPTHSFKDRVVAVALSAARELGLQVLACPSTGNLANAVAAAAARAGIRSVVLVPSNLERQKILASAVYDTTLIAVEGSYDDVNKLASEIAGEQEGWAFVNVNVRPYYAEGSKTLAFEIAEQLGWRLPDQIVIPVASG